MDTNFEFTEGDRGNMVLSEKLAKNSKLRGFKLRGLRRNQISTLDYIYIRMTAVIRLTYWVIFRIKHPRIWVPPTQFQKLLIYPGGKTFGQDWAKLLIFPA